MKGFLEFVRERGVVGFAIGFILGGAVTKLVNSFVVDIVNPLLSIFLGFTKGLEKEVLKVGPVKISWGHFATALIDFLILAAAVYFIFKVLKIEKLDLKKEKK